MPIVNDSLKDRTCKYTLTLTWDKTKISRITETDMGYITNLVIKVSGKQLSRELKEGGHLIDNYTTGWWLGTVQSRSGEPVIYRWANVEIED